MSPASVALSDIDRERFGIVVARAPSLDTAGVDEALAYCARHGVEMLIARCPASDLAAAHRIEEAGGRLMDTLVYYERRLGERDEPRPDLPVRPLAPGEAGAVSRIARECFRGYFGHYHADPRLDRARCDEGYVSWAERSCTHRSVATRVLVAEVDGDVAGFLTLLDRGGGEEEIVLNGVAPSAQRRGVYRAMVMEAIRGARARGAARLVVSTQIANLAPQKTWVRLGFEPSVSFNTFHVWFGRAP